MAYVSGFWYWFQFLAQASRGPHGSREQVPKTPEKAPSVAVPESIIPSADAYGPKAFSASFQMSSNHAVRLPESFRGGCSFGAGIKADLSRRDCTRTGGEETRSGQGCQRGQGAIKALSTSFVCCGNPMICLHSFWTPRAALSKSTCPDG